MDTLQVGKIEQLTSNLNFPRQKYPKVNGEQADQINKRLDIIEQHINLIEEVILEFRRFFPQNKSLSSS